MNPRKLIGAIAFVGLLIFGAFSQPSHDDWNVLQRLAFIIAICVTMILTLYDRRNLPRKVWDFNPKRGLLYFCLGWILFPMMIAVDSFLQANFSWAGMLAGTLAMSILIGIIGIFTENVGI